MQRCRILLAVLAVLMFARNGAASDRGAFMIDTLALDATQYDGGDSLGVSLWGETVTASKEQDWAILFGGSLGTIWPDRGDGLDYWEVGLGLKYYIFPDTSVSLLGTYRELDMPDRPDILTAEFSVKHRLLPATQAISPYLRGGIGSRKIETIPEPDVDDDFTEMILLFGAGCDFMMTDHFAIVFESIWYVTEELDDDETADWWFGQVGMKYYWD